MRYLVATDGSAVSDDAVAYAAEHAAAMDVTLEIVHVITPEAEFHGGDLVQPGEAELLADGRETLDRAETLAGETANAAVETELLTGRPAEALTEYAAESGADAIYVGHRGLSEKREQVVGSVAKSVVDRASVPVTVVR
jgi:nucleotide-binding universal stress UspA family protein